MDLKSLVMTIESYFFFAVILVMPVFALVSLFNRFRIKNVKLAIRHGALWGYPLMPSIYALVQVVCIAIALAIGDEDSAVKFGFYFLASIFWFVGAWASEQRLVTAEGIYLSINIYRQSLLKWGAITDYFAKPKKHYTEYHFFYNTTKTQNGKRILRRSVAIIRVQNSQKEAFEAILKTELEPRFEVDPAKIFRGEFKP